MSSWRVLLSLLLAGITLGVSLRSTGASPGATERVSVDSAGQEANGQSTGPSISADGRFVAFISGALNLLPNTPRPVIIPHAFIKDRTTGELRRVSIANDGTPKEGVDSATIIHTAISDDGRVVAFNTFNGGPAVYDRATGLVKELSGGDIIDVSGDGRYLEAVNGSMSILHDLVTGASEMLSHGGLLSYDGKFIAHIDSEGRVAVLDRSSNTTEVVGLNNAGEAIGLNNWPSISNDGRYVAFESQAPNIAPGDTPNTPDVFVRDRQAGETILVSKDSGGRPAGGVVPQISPDGRHVVYSTSYMVGQGRLVVHDLETGATEKVSVNSFGEEANDAAPGVTFAPQDLSADGRFIAFESNATNLVDSDTNGSADIFVHDRLAPSAQRPAPTPSSAAPADAPAPGAGVLPPLGGPPDTRGEPPSSMLMVMAGVAACLAGFVTAGAAASRVRRRR
jgi:hypothetical protein